MTRKGPSKLDARAAWSAWMSGGTQEAEAEFLDRIASWTDGTAAQLTRGAARARGPHVTRDHIVGRLHHHLGLAAGGDPITYVEALEKARRGVIEELRPPRPV